MFTTQITKNKGHTFIGDNKCVPSNLNKTIKVLFTVVIVTQWHAIALDTFFFLFRISKKERFKTNNIRQPTYFFL